MKKFKRTSTVGHILSTSWSPFYAYYILFRRSGSQKSNASNGVRIGAETKKLWLFEDNCAKLSENFTAAKWAAKWNPLAKFCKVFRSCETTCKHTCATSQVVTPSSQLWTTLRNHLQAAKSHCKSSPSCEITNSTCKVKVQTCKIDNSTCESPCEIHLCNLRYLQPTQLDFFSRYFV